jgi:predicted DNA-binding transcriptional regulator AlpA
VSKSPTTKRPAAQVAFAKKAAALKAASGKTSALSATLIEANQRHHARAALAPETPGHGEHERENVHAPRSPPTKRPLAVQVTAAKAAVATNLPALRHLQLLNRHEVVAVTGVSYPTVWAWMRKGKFPHPRIVGGKSAWLASEVQEWIDALPVRKLKGDAQEVA